jgi:Helix-turn-helix domain
MFTKTRAIPARWLTFQAGSQYVGVSVRTLQNWEKAGGFRTANVAPCGSRGRRLIDRESLDQFLESYVGSPKSEIAMNANRGGAL